MLYGLRFINISVEILTFQVIYLSFVREHPAPLQSSCLVVGAVCLVYPGRLSPVYQSSSLFQLFITMPLSISCGSDGAVNWHTLVEKLSALAVGGRHRLAPPALHVICW